MQPTETEIFWNEDWDLVQQTLLANRSGTMLVVCERLVPVICRCCSHYTG